MNLTGKTALITGGAIRIGKAIALELAESGCNVILHYNKSELSAIKLQEEINKMGVHSFLVKGDLSLTEKAAEIIDKCYKIVPRVDILINNAAIYLKGSALETTSNLWERQFSLNLKAPFFLSKAFSEYLPNDLQGKIINISDARVNKISIDHFAYRLTKQALNYMTKMLALELAPRITVNAVALGLMMPLAGYEDIDLEALAEKRIPLKNHGSAKIAADNVLHLLKQDLITGLVLTVDGGEFL